MKKITRRLFVATLLSLGVANVHAQAEDFPNKPLRMVVPFAAGSTTDNIARYIAQKLTERTGQPAIVENKPGASGFIGVQYLLSQPADGYSFMLATSTTHVSNVPLFKSLPYDPITDFEPLGGLAIGGMVLAVPASSEVKSVPELISLLKSKPGELSFGSSSSWTRGGAELFKTQAGVDMLYVPYKSMAAVITDIYGGRIDMTFGDALSIMPQVRAGKLRALGVSLRERLPGMDDVPTIAEQGLPNYEVTGWIGAFAPKGTPAPLVAKLESYLLDIAKSPDVVKFLGDNGWRAWPRTGEQLVEFQKSDIELWKKIVAESGMEVQ